jgi:outer membrane protein assembly factor BamB
LALLLSLGLFGCGRPIVLPPALFPLETAWKAAFELGVEGPLASDGERVFVATRDGTLRAYEHLTGKSLWSLSLPAGTSVGAKAGLLVARQPDGTLLGLNPENASLRWSVGTNVPGRLPPLVDGDRVFVAGEGVAAVDAATGRLAWGAPGEPTVSVPLAVFGPHLFVGESDGVLRCRERDSGLPLWAYKGRVPFVAAPAADDKRVYLGTSERSIVGLGRENGKRRWRWRLGTSVQTTPAVFGRLVIFASHEGLLYALNKRNGHLAWRTPLPSRPLSGPLLVGTAVVVACRETDILGFEARTGKRIGALKAAGEMQAPPLIVGDRLFFALLHPDEASGRHSVTSMKMDLTPRALEQAPAARRRRK